MSAGAHCMKHCLCSSDSTVTDAGRWIIAPAEDSSTKRILPFSEYDLKPLEERGAQVRTFRSPGPSVRIAESLGICPSLKRLT